MIKSMTGFGSKEGRIAAFGKVSAELRSSNHKFLEIALHLPEGFLALEEKIKKEIEARIKRGRVTCVVNILGSQSPDIFINKPLLKKYASALKNIQEWFGIKEGIRLDTLIHLPGILSLAQGQIPKERIWPGLKTLVNQALGDLVKMRSKEGQALSVYLRSHSLSLNAQLGMIKARFKKAVKDKLTKIETDEERASFLKNTDISEEIERLAFHIRNFKNKLSKNGAVGKELDFIAQEMQREANTMAAKSFDAAISAKVVQTKSQIEKLREQVQNIE